MTLGLSLFQPMGDYRYRLGPEGLPIVTKRTIRYHTEWKVGHFCPQVDMRMYRCDSCGPHGVLNLKISYDLVNKVRLSISISEVSTPIGAYAYFHALKSNPEHTDALNCRPTEYYRGLWFGCMEKYRVETALVSQIPKNWGLDCRDCLLERSEFHSWNTIELAFFDTCYTE